jgi:hypothetical protein
LYSVVPSAYTAGHSKADHRSLSERKSDMRQVRSIAWFKHSGDAFDKQRGTASNATCRVSGASQDKPHTTQVQADHVQKRYTWHQAGTAELPEDTAGFGLLASYVRTCCWRHDLVVQRYNNLIAVLVPVDDHAAQQPGKPSGTAAIRQASKFCRRLLCAAVL